MRVNVAYWVDEQFTRYTYLSIFSILKHMDKNNMLHCYLITTIPNKYILNVKNLENIFTNFKLNILPVNGKNFDKIPVHWKIQYLNYASYYIFGINLIEWVKKIIYLDSDTIINDDISILFQEDLGDKIVWVCSDMPKNYIVCRIEELRLKRKMYFNTWMLLVNLEKRKKSEVSQKCISLLKKQTYMLADQDPLNIVLQDDCKWLPWKYNVQSEYFLYGDEKFKNIWFDKKYYSDAIAYPVVIHFTWPAKPRKKCSCHKYQNYYYKIWLSSLKIWKGEINLIEYLAYIIYRIEVFFVPNYMNRRNIRIRFYKINQHIFNFYTKKIKLCLCKK